MQYYGHDDGPIYRVMITEKPSIQRAQVPVTPQIVYPLGGISECLTTGKISMFDLAG